MSKALTIPRGQHPCVVCASLFVPKIEVLTCNQESIHFLVRRLLNVEVCLVPLALTFCQVRPCADLVPRIARLLGNGGEIFKNLAANPKSTCEGRSCRAPQTQGRPRHKIWAFQLTFLQLLPPPHHTTSAAISEALHMDGRTLFPQPMDPIWAASLREFSSKSTWPLIILISPNQVTNGIP